jgi:small-conductance mechanosensitive channel
MADPNLSLPIVNSLISGGAVFLATFLALLFVWSLIVRALHSVFGKSKLYFIPKTLKELFLSIAFVFLLISIYSSVLFVDSVLLKHEIFKVWQILLVFALINIILRVVLTGLDVQYRKTKDRSGIFRSIGLIRGTIGLVLYFIAILLSVNILSEGLGVLVTALVFFIFLLIFFAAFDPIKSIMAGLQLGDYYVEYGKLIRIGGRTGFIEDIHGRSTIIRTISGERLVVPNYVFFKEMFVLGGIEDTNELSLAVEIVGKKPERIKERLSAISSKVTMALKEIPNEFKPKVFFKSIRNGVNVFSISFRASPESDVRKIIDNFCIEFSSEFGDDLRSLELS